jgi:hypothetical protein
MEATESEVWDPEKGEKSKAFNEMMVSDAYSAAVLIFSQWRTLLMSRHLNYPSMLGVTDYTLRHGSRKVQQQQALEPERALPE